MYVQVGTVSLEGWLGGVATGAFACAVLLVNNLRDRDHDKLAGKRTLSVLIGVPRSRVLYVVLMVVPFLLLIVFMFAYPEAGFVYFALLRGVPAVLIVLMARQPREYVTALQLTLLTAFAYGLGLGAALAL